MALEDVRSLGSLPSASPRISHFLLWKKERNMKLLAYCCHNCW